MPELYFRLARGLVVADPEDPAAVASLKEGLPRSAQRRMTLMGLMIHRLLEERPLDESTAIIYLTAFGESRTMEKYLASYPTPSPMGFQSSIHPSGVEQSLILRAQPVRTFLPLAGRSAIFQAMRTATALPEGTLLLGAEERGSWLADHGLSSRATYAWAVTVAGPTSAEGCFEWEADRATAASVGHLSDLPPALVDRTAWEWERPGIGTIRLRWQ